MKKKLIAAPVLTILAFAASMVQANKPYVYETIPSDLFTPLVMPEQLPLIPTPSPFVPVVKDFKGTKPLKPKIVIPTPKPKPKAIVKPQPKPKPRIVVRSPLGVQAAARLAKNYARSRTSASQYDCLYQLWRHESGWRYNALNSSSGAYGIPQALPGSKMASAGSDWRYNPITQVRWGLGYIHGRYGTPCGAWSFFLRNNWY